MIDSLMCIGSACEGHEFAKKINLRIKGPVDNLDGKSFFSVIKLFDGTFEKEIQNKSYRKFKIAHPELWRTLEYGYSLDESGYTIVHNDITQDSVYTEMLERINIFKNYVKLAEKNPNMYFLYTVSGDDIKLKEGDIQDVLSQLPKEVVSKIIIIQDRFYNEVFTKFFPVIRYKNSDEFWYETIEHTQKRFKEFIKTNNL